jgi:type I restriction enzyme S subunit
MAKYKAYPEYKDSGVEWLGEIPEHWSVSRLKHIASIYGRIGFRGYTVDDIVDEGEGALVLSPSNIEGDKFSTVKKTYLRWGKFYESPEIIVEQNDILLVKTGSTYGKSTIIKVLSEPMTINPQMALIKRSFIDSRFLAYLFNGSLIKAKIEVINTGSGMPTMTQENINHFPIPLPNHKYDIQIADFLDHETAKIDNLIENQQQLIELLKEKRQAVISHAVTKGLNPDVAMKDSGVEWLGEVPEHWHKIKLKYITNKIIDAEHKTAEYFDDGEYLVCRTTNVRNGKLDLDGGMYTDLDTYNKWIKRGKPEAGDILFTREAPAGEACVYSGDIPLCLGQRMVLFKLNVSRVVPEFVLYSIYSGLADDFVKQLSQGSTVSHFNMSDIQNLPLYEPPLCEQSEIKKYLACNLYKHDSLIASAQNMISLMQERRTALISAAVTGKIDVRDWVAPDTSHIEASEEATA